MASKIAVATSHNENPDQRPQVQDVVMEIDGLEHVGGAEFRLANVPVAHVPFNGIFDLLNTSGISRREATRYAEEICELVAQGEMARLLASRMRRVG